MKMKSLVTTADIPAAKRFAFWREAVCHRFAQVECSPLSDRPFAGEIATTRVREVTFSRVRGLEHKCDRTPLQIRQARDETVFINLQVSGRWWSTQDGREAVLEAGDFACFDSTRPFSGIQSRDFEQLVIHVPRDLWRRRIGPTERLTARAVRGDTRLGSLVSGGLRQLTSVAEEKAGEGSHHLVELLLALAATGWGELMEEQESCQSSGRSALLCRAKGVIEENLHDPDLRPDQVARLLKISTRYLQELFRKENLTVNHWIWSRRLDRCRRDLADPLMAGRSVSQIAFQWGFSDFSHFSHRFKAAFAVPPSEFRRQQRSAA
ncbi:MAG: helix-turn-helix domain-containing protein [Desulfuromonadales bacterium]|nr:helix-turn-helix domain-containing protein [Desulfuromonadales bacterium]